MDTASFLDRSLEEAKVELYLQALPKVTGFIYSPWYFHVTHSTGSRLTVSPCKMNDLKKGDIILTVQRMQSMIKEVSKWVVHRIMKQCQLIKFLPGDRLPILDSPQCYESVKGVITAIKFPQKNHPTIKDYFFRTFARKPRQFHSRYAGILVSNLYQVYFRLKKILGQ